jgi:hypothetical protein
MDKFLDAFDLPKLNQEDINYLNRFIMSNEIETVIVSYYGKSQDPMDLLLDSLRPLNKNQHQYYTNFSMK